MPVKKGRMKRKNDFLGTLLRKNTFQWSGGEDKESRKWMEEDKDRMMELMEVCGMED